MAASWGNSGRRRLLFAGRAAGGILAAFLLSMALGGAGRTAAFLQKAADCLRGAAAGLAVLERVEETGAGASPGGNSVEEGIQIRLDEMRILFFRIRREEERAEEKRTGRTGAE